MLYGCFDSNIECISYEHFKMDYEITILSIIII